MPTARDTSRIEWDRNSLNVPEAVPRIGHKSGRQQNVERRHGKWNSWNPSSEKLNSRSLVCCVNFAMLSTSAAACRLSASSLDAAAADAPGYCGDSSEEARDRMSCTIVKLLAWRHHENNPVPCTLAVLFLMHFVIGARQ